MLREHYNDVGSITIRKVTSEKVSYCYDWNHPGVRNLRLDSVCVEVNSRRKQPWAEMPAKAFEITKKLNDAGIPDTSALIDILSSEEGCVKFQTLFRDTENILHLFQSTLNITRFDF